MRRSQQLFMFVIAMFFFFSISLGALTIDEIMRHRRADRSVAFRTSASEEETNGVGVKEVENADGRREKIYFSVSGPEEDKAREEEKMKSERAWEMLKGIIIEKQSP